MSCVSDLRPPLLVTDEILVLEMDHQVIPVRHGDHQATSIRGIHQPLVSDLLLLPEQFLINVFEDTEDRG